MQSIFPAVVSPEQAKEECGHEGGASKGVELFGVSPAVLFIFIFAIFGTWMFANSSE